VGPARPGDDVNNVNDVNNINNDHNPVTGVDDVPGARLVV
jgi:hypothetical protein